MCAQPPSAVRKARRHGAGLPKLGRPGISPMLGRPDLGANGTRNWPQSDMPPLLAALLGGPRRPLLGGAARRTQPLAGVPKLSAESAATSSACTPSDSDEKSCSARCSKWRSNRLHPPPFLCLLCMLTAILLTLTRVMLTYPPTIPSHPGYSQRARYSPWKAWQLAATVTA